MRKLRQRITLNDVNQAINSLKEQNLNPTADSILAEVIRQSNGTVGGSKGTVLKFKRQLEGTDNYTSLSTVRSTSTVQYSTNKPNHSTETVLNSIDDKLLSTLEVQLWTKLEARLDDKLREKLEVYQVSELPHNRVNELEEALQEMCELWLDSITQYTAAKANLDGLEKEVTQLNSEVQRLSESEAQAIELHQVNERSALENNELKSKLEALQQLIQTKDEEIEELSLENNELKLRIRPDHEAQPALQTQNEEIARLKSTLDQTTNQIEAQQNQFNQLNQDLHELHELWLAAVFQIQTATPSASVSTTTETDPLESYFQVLDQLHNRSSAQKYDYAMRLFERGLGPSEVSRILKVNKGSLQHYKEGKRKRPNSD